jgi:hypothetical protein
MAFLPTVSLNAFHPGSLSSDAARLYAPGTVGRHPLRRRTDVRDVVDVDAREVRLDPVHAQQAYAAVADLANPVYRPGLVVNLTA